MSKKALRSEKGLSRQKYSTKNITKSKQEKITQLERKFITSFKINTEDIVYDPLKDKYSVNYFANRPVKKHIKRLAKVLNFEQSTTQNMKLIKSINQALSLPKIQYSPDKKVDIQADKNTKSKEVEDKKSRIKVFSQKQTKKDIFPRYFDPYLEVLRPKSIDKLTKIHIKARRIRLVSQNNKKTQHKDDKLQDKSSVLSLRKLPVDDTKYNKNYSMEKRQKRSQEKNRQEHKSLLNFINQKKSQISTRKIDAEPIEDQIDCTVFS